MLILLRPVIFGVFFSFFGKPKARKTNMWQVRDFLEYRWLDFARHIQTAAN